MTQKVQGRAKCEPWSVKVQQHKVGVKAPSRWTHTKCVSNQGFWVYLSIHLMFGRLEPDWSNFRGGGKSHSTLFRFSIHAHPTEVHPSVGSMSSNNNVYFHWSFFFPLTIWCHKSHMPPALLPQQPADRSTMTLVWTVISLHLNFWQLWYNNYTVCICQSIFVGQEVEL